MRTTSWGLVGCVVWLAGGHCLGGEQPPGDEPRRPHVVVILADDMGFSDIGCYGGEIDTPTLDRLAAEGLRMTQCSNTSRCCPTRAALLTGLYSHQAGIGLMTGDRGYDAYRGDLNRHCVTLAEVLSDAGYGTYLSGKWHVTKHTGPEGPKHNWPRQRGFDRFYGTVIGAGSFFDPATLCRENTYVTPENDVEYQPETYYYTDAITDHAVQFLEQHAQTRGDDPCFLYVSYTCAHWPLHALEVEIAKYQGRYDGGYQAVSDERLARARELGVIDASWDPAPLPRSWENAAHPEWELRSMEVYAAMIDRMDQGIGRIVSTLDELGWGEETVIVYLQDNGACAEGFGRQSNAKAGADFAGKPFEPDTLQTKIWPPMQTRDGRWVRTGPEVMAGAEDTFVAYGTAWASVSNTPFRGYKHDAYEGGLSTPCIVHWPSGIETARRGSLVHDPCHVFDLMPTLVELAGATYPDQRDGESITPMEGASWVPVFRGDPLARRAPLAYEHHGNLALRDGRWKIVSQYRKDKTRTWQLFDLVADRTEQHDLAGDEPERLAAMIAAWDDWALRVGVQTWPFPNKK